LRGKTLNDENEVDAMVTKTLQQSQLNASLTDLPPLGMDVFDMVEDFRSYYT
jgi:hypothetical protein